jgi:flagellar assembly factor FliW
LEAAAVEIDTTRFGKIRIKGSDLIIMRGCILGFEKHKRFVLLTVGDNSPLFWLQSVEDPAIAFVIINPRTIEPGYSPAIPETDLESLDIKETEETALLSIVTVRSHPFRATANLRAPILVNTRKGWAKQLVLDDPDYPIRRDILGDKTDFKSGLSVEKRMGGNLPDGLHPLSAVAG